MLYGLRVEWAFRLKKFLARGVNPLRHYQLRQQCRVGDTSRALSNSVANVGINPLENIDFQALLNVIKEYHPLLGHLRSMHCGHKFATYKMVLDFYIL